MKGCLFFLLLFLNFSITTDCDIQSIITQYPRNHLLNSEFLLPQASVQACFLSCSSLLLLPLLISMPTLYKYRLTGLPLTLFSQALLLFTPFFPPQWSGFIHCFLTVGGAGPENRWNYEFHLWDSSPFSLPLLPPLFCQSTVILSSKHSTLSLF